MLFGESPADDEGVGCPRAARCRCERVDDDDLGAGRLKEFDVLGVAEM
jgi:hypothetical protein